jgi:DNA-directed RNA polymerase subunit M/transcription elongation factor TFIIS
VITQPSRCRQCGHAFSFSDADLEPLSPSEMAICAAQGLRIEGRAGLACPSCGAKALIPTPIGMQPPQPRSEITVNGRTFEVMPTAELLGRSLSREPAGAVVTSWDQVGATHLAAMRAAIDAGVNAELCQDALRPSGGVNKIMVACTACHVSSSGEALARLVFLTQPDMGRVAGSGGLVQQLEQVQDGRCPKCGNHECYYIVNLVGLASV